MTERERLIELIKEGQRKAGEHIREVTKKVLAEKGKFNSSTDYERSNIYEIEADYLLANGVVCPPCKVGDVVYDIHYGKVFGGKVIMLNMFDDCFTFVATGGRYYKDDDIGKTVFLTKEEAEQALKGGAE